MFDAADPFSLSLKTFYAEFPPKKRVLMDSRELRELREPRPLPDYLKPFISSSHL